MPPKAQRTLSFAPPLPPVTSTPSRTRATPRRNASTIANYAYLERIDEPFCNPTPTPRASIRTQDDDIIMGDREDDEDNEDDVEESEEVIIVPDPNTPTRQKNLPSTVVVKRRHVEKARKERKQRT
jgi:hypothetical protein